jgi:hypothetical protein
MWSRRTVVVRSALILVLPLAASLLAAPSRAESYRVAAVGGPGHAFDLQCPLGEFLVGIGPLWKSQYVQPLSNLVAYCKEAAPGPVWGSDENREIGMNKMGVNSYYSVFCPQNMFVTAVNLALTPHPARVEAVSIFCKRKDGRGKFVEMVMPIGSSRQDAPISCKDNDLVRGLHGTYDVYVNSVGVLCDVIPGPAPVSVKEQAKKLPCAFCKEEVIQNPSINDVALDVCLNWGTGCGKPAADAFCQQHGFNYSSAQTTQPNAPPTYVLGDNRICNESFCTRFTSITCNR